MRLLSIALLLCASAFAQTLTLAAPTSTARLACADERYAVGGRIYRIGDVYPQASKCVPPDETARPEVELTPGEANPAITKEVLCSPTFRTAAYRHTSRSLKRLVCAVYGAMECPGPKWELDHLIPIELGGADTRLNLWAQPISEAHDKDKVENWLRREVCADRMSLESAQKAIATDWFQLYLQMQRDK